jgi:hypothetical protein
MASLLYKDHLIVGYGIFEEATQLWIPTAIVSWEAGGSRELHSITDSPERFADQKAAENFALEMAKAWVDSRLSSI